MSSLLDIQIVNAKAALKRIRRERQEAKSEHEMKVCERSSRLSKIQRRLESAARRSKLHWYMDSLRAQDPALSMYILQKQSRLCMALHRRDVLVREYILSKVIQEELVEEMLRDHSKTRKTMRRQKERLVHQLSVRTREGGSLRAGYEKKLAEQQLVIKHLRELLDEDDDSATEGGSGHYYRHEAAPAISSLVKGIFDTVQKRNDEFKLRLQEHSHLSVGATFQRKTHQRRKVVADVA
jgi:hypothetical protein